MHLKLMHFGSSFACILGKFLVYIELNFNAKWRVSSVDLSVDLSVDFVCKIVELDN